MRLARTLNEQVFPSDIGTIGDRLTSESSVAFRESKRVRGSEVTTERTTMILKSIDYVQYEGELEEWRLKDFTLGPVNLLVGKNATGKSRSLNIMKGLANLLSGDLKPTQLKSGKWTVEFSHKSDSPVYELEIHEAEVRRESFVIEGRKRLERSGGGKGKIYAERLEKEIDFQTPENELAVVARRDNIQHPSFELLHDWGETLRHYPFGTPLGKNNFLALSGEGDDKLNTKDAGQVDAIFHKGEKDYGDDFTEAVTEDMKRIGYANTKVGLAPPTSLIIAGQDREVVCLYVQETELRGITDQHDMSQGMFRALSVIIQLNYSYLSGNPSCILIDDIGEGLDFERSSALLELLVEKAEGAGVQLVMATNDRLVMNCVPLEMWTLLQREGGDTHLYNYTNSKREFDEFKFTGLNNFDFLAVDFLSVKSLPDA